MTPLPLLSSPSAKSRLDYWLPKLAANTRRDAAKCAELEAMGWSTFTVWQCQTKKLGELAEVLADFLDDKNPIDIQ